MRIVLIHATELVGPIAYSTTTLNCIGYQMAHKMSTCNNYALLKDILLVVCFCLWFNLEVRSL